MIYSNKNLLFVYGTLRKDYGSTVMEEVAGDCVFIGLGKAKGTLYDLGDYPGAVERWMAKEIKGDVYEVVDAKVIFRLLDEYEGEEYCRKKTTVLLDAGDKIEAFIYWYTGRVEGAVQIEEGDYLDYLKNKKDRFL